MNSAIAVDSNPSAADNSGIIRASLAAAFVAVGLVLLYVANRYVRRHHKGRRHHRY
jgi:hypothetical protein